ncbi:MAG TPA: EamA family transporter RarD [Phycisphaerales bacterium]|nr:EamA family transporter RarD [Phycisphaerales bacterium]HIB51070.1 EamA family transporter RarD [Phycisphaerales bacterium]HIN84112.1 EamA family transporter RarD [Phycisphaerales bacterium]HIO53352.1 EamA family transporter RarD [Phycisphaerales bacterium]
MDLFVPTLVSFDLITQSKSVAGVLFAIGSYLWWAFVTPIYFKLFKEVPVVELVIWRVISGLPLLLGLLFFRHKIKECFSALRDKKTFLLLVASAIFISVNWIVFVISVVTDRLIDSSLGYYINPLVTVALGFLFLGERLRKLQVAAVGIAFVGVVYLTFSQGSLPWISITLPCTFAMYGLMRKIMGVGSIEGLTIEMTFALPICIVLQGWLISNGTAVSTEGDWYITGGLLLGGLVTIVPLLLFASGARRLKFSTLGILQYIAPSGQLILATVIFKEEFGLQRGIVFGLIFLAVLLYSYDSWKFSTAQIEPAIE